MSYTFEASVSFDPTECTFEFTSNSEILVTDANSNEFFFNLEFQPLGIRFNTDTGRTEFGTVIFTNPQFCLQVNSRSNSFQMANEQPVLVIGTDDIRDIKGMEATITVILATRPVRLVAASGNLTMASYGEEPTGPGEYEGMIITE